MKKKELCPECRQNLNERPHEGYRDKYCSHCGQGLRWRYNMRLEKKKLNRR